MVFVVCVIISCAAILQSVQLQTNILSGSEVSTESSGNIQLVCTMPVQNHTADGKIYFTNNTGIQKS